MNNNNFQQIESRQPGSILLYQKVRFNIWFPIITLFALATGYTIWSFSQAPGPFDNEIIPVSKANQNSSPSPLFDKEGKGEFASWKTYRNEEYGFEVKYPVDWKLNTAASGFNDGDDYFSFSGGSKSVIAILPRGEFDYGVGLDYKLEDGQLAGKQIKIRSWEDGSKWYHLIENEPNWSVCKSDLKSCNRITISVNKDEEDLVNQILATFKFIK